MLTLPPAPVRIGYVGHSHLLALAQASKLTKISKSLTPAPARKEQKYQTSILGSLQS
jgi:hypothetical protein